MKKLILSIIFVFAITGNIWAACTGSGPYTCSADTSATDLQTCITNAAAGATINLGSGTHTWNGQITITKAINIIGSGIGVTTVNSTYSKSGSCGYDTTCYGIVINPSTPSSNPVIRISGFTYNTGSYCFGILYNNSSESDDMTNIRIDHLDITSSEEVFDRHGLAHGVMDNCIIRGPGKMQLAGDIAIWTYNSYEFGTNSNFYFEDNIFYVGTTGCVHSGEGPGRYAFRYNTLSGSADYNSLPFFDQHGSNPNHHSGYGGEIYGNVFIAKTGSGVNYATDARGGKWLQFYNSHTTDGGSWHVTGYPSNYRFREEYQDSSQPPATAPNGQPQHVSSSYVWSNYEGSTRLIGFAAETLTCSTCSETVPTENIHFWNHDTTNCAAGGAACSQGMGCGTLANKPTNCTTGTAYWATNQSCTTLTGMVGVNPSTPISGQLYKCTSTNTWTADYTPYPYPHPLRGESGSGEYMITIAKSGAGGGTITLGP